MEAADSSGSAGHVGASTADRCRRQHRERGLVLQRIFSLDWNVVLRAHHRALVLVHRPVHSAESAWCSQRKRGAARRDLRVIPEALPGLPLHYSRPDLLCAGQERQGTRAQHDRWS